jgi:hypothetical protein
MPDEGKLTWNERRGSASDPGEVSKDEQCQPAELLDQVVRRLAVGSNEGYEKEPHRRHLGEALYWAALLAPRQGPRVYQRP